MQLRVATEADFDQAMSLINQAKAHLKAQGIDQWQRGYPDEDCIRDDIQKQRGYLVADGDVIAGYLCIDFGGEPAYDTLKGQWKSDGAYGVIHRMAIGEACQGKGIADTVFALAQELCVERGVRSMRVDTDQDNRKMQHILEKNGFTYCGIVWFVDSEKLGFEKILEAQSLSS